MSDEFKNSKYYKIFEDELKAFKAEGEAVDTLYDEAHKVFEKKTQSGSTMFGSSSGDKDAIEMSKSLCSIRQTKINVLKELAGLKKNVAELMMKEKQQDAATDEARDKQLMLAILEKMTSKKTTEFTGVVESSPTNDGLDKLNTDDIKFTNVDAEMIKRFKENNSK